MINLAQLNALELATYNSGVSKDELILWLHMYKRYHKEIILTHPHKIEFNIPYGLSEEEFQTALNHIPSHPCVLPPYGTFEELVHWLYCKDTSCRVSSFMVNMLERKPIALGIYVARPRLNSLAMTHIKEVYTLADLVSFARECI